LEILQSREKVDDGQPNLPHQPRRFDEPLRQVAVGQQLVGVQHFGFDEDV
jgi:hypothetical protein